jgi:hypothetical protein
MLYSEYILERLEELYACLENFPESPMRPVWEKAVSELEEKAAIYC